MRNKAILIFVLFFLPFFIPKGVFAQGYFDCQWGDGACSFRSHDCEEGYGPTDYCERITEESLCKSLVKACERIEATPPPPSCAIEGQFCNADKPCCTADLVCDPTYSVCFRSEVTPFCAGANEINTAIGCIPINDIVAMAGFMIIWSIGIGSGIAFLLMLYAGYMMMTSSGQPRRLQAAKELFVSAMAGLIMLVFSVFILRIIGFDILGVF